MEDINPAERYRITLEKIHAHINETDSYIEELQGFQKQVRKG
jgi:hypothetical protein